MLGITQDIIYFGIHYPGYALIGLGGIKSRC